jgi:Outer membrane efflux protein
LNFRSADHGSVSVPKAARATGCGELVASTLIPSPVRIFSLGGSILAPLFDSGRLKAQQESVAARRDQAAFAYGKTPLSAFREVEDAMAGIQRISEQEAALAAERDVLARTLTLATNRYRAGYSAHLDQFDAERGLLSAKLTVAQSRTDRLNALVSLYQALGGGWQGTVLDCVETDLLNPKRLAEFEARYHSSRPATVDYRARVAVLERQVQNYVKMIGAGEYSSAVSTALKAAEAELEHLKAMSQAHPRPAREASTGPLASRVERMRERLAKGGEIARGVLREVFPESIWLEVAPSRKHFYAIFEDGIRAALFDDRCDLGQFPLEESDVSLGKVGESGSGGPLRAL